MTNNRWLVDAFRCATIQKDDKLEMEIFFINMVKKQVWENKQKD